MAKRKGQKDAKHRTKEDIIADMLVAVSNNTKIRKTHIMYEANLSYKLLRRYLRMITPRFLRLEENGTYSITEEGLRYLEVYTRYKESERLLLKRKLELDRLINS